jgi:DNA-binding NarL/FixJ family response regulator
MGHLKGAPVMLRIVLVDDHPIVRAGFRQLLDREPGWQVVAAVGGAHELAAWLLTSTCDVLVLDLSLADGDGLVMIRHLLAQRPTMAIVILTMHDNDLFVQDALSAGARGYVTKRSAPDELIAAIRTVERGEIYVASDVRPRSPGPVEAGDAHLVPELTGREAQVFLLLARGHSVSRVASTIGISNKTAYAHRSSIYAKLGLNSDYELRMLARRRGIIT